MFSMGASARLAATPGTVAVRKLADDVDQAAGASAVVTWPAGMLNL